MISIDAIDRAAAWLRERVDHTLLVHSTALSTTIQAPIWLKMDHLQRTGSFKVRGALYALSRLPDNQLQQGVVTCSAGNHGKGMAYAAQQLDVPVRIYVPQSVDEAKYAGMIALGATVIRSSFPGYDATEAWARAEATRLERPFVSAFDDWDIIAGNGGSLGVEIAADIEDVGTLLFSVGGGGYGAGLAFYLKSRFPDLHVVAVQHEGCPALAQSLARGAAVTAMPALDTVAGGLEGGLGVRPFQVLRHAVDAVAHVSEDEIKAAVRWLLAEHQTLVEPSAAVTVAALLHGKVQLPNARPVVTVLTGRNVSYSTLRSIVCATS
ncbi:MAG: pyridoxal-phosphate dependent enzyme [Bacteroidota bacterium]